MAAPSVVIVTPTCGSPKLLDAMKSVSEQTYPAHHLMVVDGPQYAAAFSDVVASFSPPQHYTSSDLYLPENTGKALGKSYVGYRIYAGIANFVNQDIIMFLDDDNWYEPDHVASQVANIVANNLSFSFCLRNIYTEDKEFLCRDDCESLGTYPVWNSKPGEEHYHIDTSAYAFRREYLVEFGHWWHGRGYYGQDRMYLEQVRRASAEVEAVHRHQSTGRYTLNYRLGSTSMSVPTFYFQMGNEEMRKKYGEKFPWAK